MMPEEPSSSDNRPGCLFGVYAFEIKGNGQCLPFQPDLCPQIPALPEIHMKLGREVTFNE